MEKEQVEHDPASAQSSHTWPMVYAVVLNWNGYEDTAACVESLEQATYPNLQIVIVDNGSTDGSAAKISKYQDRHRILPLPANGGYAKGNNAGIRYSLGHGADFILLLNNDVVVDRGFLEPLVMAARKDAHTGIVTGKAYLDDTRSRRYTTGGYFRRWRCNIAPLPDHEADRQHTVTALSGCFLLIRREVFETVGLLNEEFFLYFEDLEFTRRAGRRYSMRYIPESVIRHRSGAGVGWSSYSPTYLFHATRNRFLAFRQESFWYKLYVVLFSGLNVLAKSMRIVPSVVGDAGERHMVRKRLQALLSGLKEGLIIGFSGKRSG